MNNATEYYKDRKSHKCGYERLVDIEDLFEPIEAVDEDLEKYHIMANNNKQDESGSVNYPF